MSVDTPTDAVIVLANLMDINGVLNHESRARAEKSAELFKQNNAPYLVTCGWAYRQDSDIKIADAFKQHIASKLEVDAKQILTEVNSRDTVGDAFFTKIHLAIPRAWRHLCVVTSDYHVERTREIFNFIYGPNFVIEVFGAKIDCNDSILKNEISSTEAFRNTFAGIDAGDDCKILDRLRERHPFYNGVIYDKI